MSTTRNHTCDHCGEIWTGDYETTQFEYIMHACPHFAEPSDTCEACNESEAE